MTSVCKSIKPANPAARAPRATRSKFALQASARKLRFLGLSSSSQARFPSPGLVGCKSRKHKSGGGLRARASCAASAISHTLANLTTWRPPRGRLRIVIWLILPVVICLSQRLSHACLSISVIQRNCEWLIKTVIVYLIIEFTWITVVILELIHAGMLDFCGRAVFIR